MDMYTISNKLNRITWSFIIRHKNKSLFTMNFPKICTLDWLIWIQFDRTNLTRINTAPSVTSSFFLRLFVFESFALCYDQVFVGFFTPGSSSSNLYFKWKVIKLSGIYPKSATNIQVHAHLINLCIWMYRKRCILFWTFTVGRFQSSQWEHTFAWNELSFSLSSISISSEITLRKGAFGVPLPLFYNRRFQNNWCT